jgi:hypothetical protein
MDVDLKGDRMTTSKERRHDQICVGLDPELRAALERAAAADHRTVSGQVRHLLATAFEQEQRAA